MEIQEWINLVIEAQAGNGTAFGQLVRRFESDVYAIVLRRLKNHNEAAEVTQDVFLQVFRKLRQLREPERFAGWLRQIAVRMAINRAVRRPHETIPGPDAFSCVEATPSNPLDQLLSRENIGDLREGLDRLKELDRQTLVAFYIEGQSLKEMSTHFDSPIGTIKRRLHTARNRLRSELGDLQIAG